MKQLFIKSILCFTLAAATASASSILCADQTAGPTGVGGNTLDQYIALGSSGCMIGNLLFNNFAYSYSLGTDSFYVSGLQGTGIQQTANMVAVTVNALNDQFKFNANWIVNRYQTATLSLSFDVAAPSGNQLSTLQNQFTATQGGTQNGGPISTKAATCTGGTCGSPTNFTNLEVNIPLTQGPLQIVNSLFMNANSSTNASTNNYHLSVLTDQFAATAPPSVPEPVTTLLMGSSLLGLVLMARKRRQS